MQKEIGTFQITVTGIGNASHSGKISIKKEENGWLGAEMEDDKIAVFYNLVGGGKTVDVEIRGAQVRHDILAMFSFTLPDNGAEIKATRIDKIRGQNTQNCAVTIKRIWPEKAL